MADSEDLKPEQKDQASKGSLVPLYSPLDVRRGIQAYRRGDVILYTVRGEPRKVQELIGELDRRGVGELVALVSHRVGSLDMLGEAKRVVDVKADDDTPQEGEAEPSRATENDCARAHVSETRARASRGRMSGAQDAAERKGRRGR